ncbi:sensor histidine kinase [Arthrobacter sp. MDT3-44]
MALVQLPLTVIIGCVALSAPVAWPGLLREPLFQLSLVVHAVLFLLCWLIPWERLPAVATLSIPIGDVFAVILSRTGAVEFLPGLSVLMIFPVIWLAASGRFPKSAVAGSFLIPLVMGAVPLLVGSAQATATKVTTTVLVALMLFAVAFTVRFVTATLFLQQRKLERKDEELQRLLDSSKENENLLKTILDTINVGVTAVDATGRVILSNRQQDVFARSASGTDQDGTGNPGLVLYGQDRTFLLPEDRTPMARAMRGETFADYHVWVGNGRTARALSTAARSISAGPGTSAGAVIAYTDVTSLVETVAAKDEVIATVSHELRSPLTSIVGNLELAQDATDLQAASHYVDTASRAADRLTELVSDLLLSNSAAMTVHPRETDIAGLVDSVISSVSSRAAAAGIAIRTEVPAPLWVHADPLRMGQVLDNLLTNAIKYSPDGGVVVVKARTKDGQLELVVEDTGMGMSPQDAARVFDRFFRTESARDSTIPGTGLGLSITRAIVEGHGGKIVCRSEVGRGTTFMVNVPSPDIDRGLGTTRQVNENRATASGGVFVGV